MIAFSTVKINLGLRILSKRADGYHNIESVFYPLHWGDVIEIIPSKGKTALHLSGLAIPGNENDNLCLKAYQLLRNDFKLEELDIYLHKIIPTGTGLGGGSADGAYVLKLINSHQNLGLSDDQLAYYAAKLGSDCPFFVYNKPMLVTETGHQLSPFPIDLSNYKIALVIPNVHVSTALAYRLIKPEIPQLSITETLLKPIEKWKDELINDFEEPVMEHFPQLRKIKEKLYEQGALYASMSGSGSSFYGIFNQNQNPNIQIDNALFKLI